MDDHPPRSDPTIPPSPADSCPDSVSRLWPRVVGESLSDNLAVHVHGCPRCQSRIDNLRKDIVSLRESLGEGQVIPTRPVEAPPQQIGDYLILAILGHGGQATVYRAWHPRLRIDVVLKWFRSSSPWIVDPERLSTEAALLGSIRHPHLGRVFDVGIWQGRPFLVMEYVRGKTMSQWVRSEQPSPRRLATLLAKAALAVHEVHRFGALHLDLKPQNILVDEADEPRVIDFGMARLSDRRAGAAPQWIAETPEYMSPEQCLGDADLISERTDVYGLGAVLYWGITESPPRRVGDVPTKLPPALSAVPGGLRKICRKALAVRLRDRYASCQEMADDLFQFARWSRFKYRLAAVLIGCVGLISLLASAWQEGGVGLFSLAEVRLHPDIMLQTGDRRVSQVQLAVQSEYPWPAETVVATSCLPPFVLRQRFEGPLCLDLPPEEGKSESAFRVTMDAGCQLYVACNLEEWSRVDVSQIHQHLTLLNRHPWDTQAAWRITRQGASPVKAWAEGVRVTSESLGGTRSSVDSLHRLLRSHLSRFDAVLVTQPQTAEVEAEYSPMIAGMPLAGMP